ncbi:teichoic acid D-Ala incorporation-associated protein DltX [Secundilactobacillus paracollinoides]|nr:teichoic acid D-Ala incorporation-associated protein DltX [Secundilactobacillus paracollinoides]
MTAWASQHTAVLSFTAKTVSYFVIILALVYLYDYCGVNGAHFIYNEF